MKTRLLNFFFLFALLTSCNARDDIRQMSASEFRDAVAGDSSAALLDVRSAKEYAGGHLASAMNIDILQEEAFVSKAKSLDKSKTWYIYCRSGRRSMRAACLMKDLGYSVVNMEGGITAWEKAKFPVTTSGGKISDNSQSAATERAKASDTFTTRSGKTVVISHIKHGSLRITACGKEIEIDPVTALPPRTDYSKLPKADYILITHTHHDHCDKTAVAALQKPGTKIVGNADAVKQIGSGTALRNGEKLQLSSDISVEAVAAYNTSPEKLAFHPKGRDNGYVLTIDGMRIYIAGDTEPIAEMEALESPDIAFLPCNLPYTMSPGQCAAAAQTIKPSVLFPYHFGETDVEKVAEMLHGTGIDVRIRSYR